VKHRKGPGPNEDLAEEGRSEGGREQMPDGILPGGETMTDPRRTTAEMIPLSRIEREDVPQPGGDSSRRTSLDRDNIRPVGTATRPAEERVDHSTDDGQRENVLDPTPDESGPQSDQA